MTAQPLASLDSVAWDRLETAYPGDRAGEIPRALRRIAEAGAEATEADCEPLWVLVARDGRMCAAAVAALPFVTALAADPGVGARFELVQLLAYMQGEGAADEDWAAARALLADPDPAVRRAAIQLADGVGRLIEQWRIETDPTVRVPLLMALGSEAAASTEPGPVAEARAVLAQVLEGDDPVLEVAAVYASASLDREVPRRRLGRVVEVFSDARQRPRFPEMWWSTADEEIGFEREDVVRWGAELFRHHDPDVELDFCTRLADAAYAGGDSVLSRLALELAWDLLTRRRSVAAALPQPAGRLLTDRDAELRLRAAHLLAMLGRASAPYADRLAALLDDTAGAGGLDGRVCDFARWALARIGDPRALPGLVEQLCAQCDEEGRGYVVYEPHRPEPEDVLVPLRAHADVLLPAIRDALRRAGSAVDDPTPALVNGPARPFLRVLAAWGEDALPALPEVVPFLRHTFTGLDAALALGAMGPGAAAAAEAVRACSALDYPGNHMTVAYIAARIAGDDTAELAFVGDKLLADDEWSPGAACRLARFGATAAPYADAVRRIMDSTDPWSTIGAAATLWSITGRPEPSASVLEEYVLPVADGGDLFGLFREALRALIPIGRISPTARAALRAIRDADRRLSHERDHTAVLRDEELCALIDAALAGGGPEVPR
ncbi:hypothetical protein [Yinghuangia seranimata]|uniref:hypothetical protein n=1 Tax=Yinghuangia seranimata TaxID=408067 RepID=UPI00248CB828|nr:hypothetical protein [Yinghuangia seranimata]MDI2124695.1 hypothetical protein [Yinghuangia seranimata]